MEPIYTRADAVAAGMTRAQLRDDGRRVTRGVYLSRALSVNLPDLTQAVLRPCPPGTVASHRTAATLLGAPVDAARPVEVAVPPGAYRPRRRGVRVHVRDLVPADITVCRGIPVTSGAQTWLDLAADTAPAELVAIGDALFRAGVLDTATLARRLARADGLRGVVAARRCGGMLTPEAASRPESLIRYALLDSHLPPPQVQLPVQDRRGRTVAHADLGYAAWRIAIEYEGRHHAEHRQFARDLTRYSLMASNGWLLLRFGGSDAFRPHLVVTRVEGALRSRGASW